MKITIPKKSIMGTPIEGAIERALAEAKEEQNNQGSTVTQDLNGFIKLPSGIYISKERTHLGKTWYETHEELAKQGTRIPTIPEFIEFLNYTKTNHQDIYNEITEVKVPWRSEWLDAYFEERPDGLYILTHNKTNAKKLDPKTLMEDKIPGISLDSWLRNPTKQGLPRSNVAQGEFYYWHPRNERVAWFGAGSDGAVLYCDWDPSIRDVILGVYAVAQGKQ